MARSSSRASGMALRLRVAMTLSLTPASASVTSVVVMIKYLGSKRRLVPVLGDLCERAGARTALDLFTGTTRVAQEFKRRGARVRAVDTARYSDVIARCDVAADARAVDEAELAYLDPPYNQHSYDRNYHMWETLVAWDEPKHYGVACKRSDCRDPATRSAFESRPAPRDALARVVREVRARVLVLSYNDESWIGLDDLVELCSARGAVRVLAFDSKRYVGAQIGIHDPAGRRVGEVGRLRNVEYLLVAGDPADVADVAGRGAPLAA